MRVREPRPLPGEAGDLAALTARLRRLGDGPAPAALSPCARQRSLEEMQYAGRPMDRHAARRAAALRAAAEEARFEANMARGIAGLRGLGEQLVEPPPPADEVKRTRVGNDWDRVEAGLVVAWAPRSAKPAVDPELVRALAAGRAAAGVLARRRTAARLGNRLSVIWLGLTRGVNSWCRSTRSALLKSSSTETSPSCRR